MRYRLPTLLIVFSIVLPWLPAYAQKAPRGEAQKDRKSNYYEQLILQGMHPIEAQIKDDLLYTRLIWNRPQQAFQSLDDLEKELSAIQTDAADTQQVIVRARSLIHEERTALEVYSTPLEDWAKRLDEKPSDVATMSKYVRKAKDLFGVRGDVRPDAAAKGLAEVQARLTKLEQQLTDDDVKKHYADAKAELARIERATKKESRNRN